MEDRGLKYWFLVLGIVIGCLLGKNYLCPQDNSKTTFSESTVAVRVVERATLFPTTVPTLVKQERSVVEAQVLRVIDGDTIEVLSGGVAYSVRYIGIDTPEMPSDLFAEDAKKANVKLVSGERVLLEKDKTNKDKYGRLLRNVFVGNTFVNGELVRLGMAKVTTYPPDVKYEAQLLSLQSAAQRNGWGLWQGTKAEPAVSQEETLKKWQGIWSETQGMTQTGPAVSPQKVVDCVIKGNISFETGEKIYHVPGGQYYEATVISPSKGERWFCTEEEAVANGWRRSKR